MCCKDIHRLTDLFCVDPWFQQGILLDRPLAEI